jgi:hypothetical protein
MESMWSAVPHLRHHYVLSVVGSTRTYRSYLHVPGISSYYETALVAPRYRTLELWSGCIDHSQANASHRCNNLRRQKASNNELPGEPAEMI